MVLKYNVSNGKHYLPSYSLARIFPMNLHYVVQIFVITLISLFLIRSVCANDAEFPESIQLDTESISGLERVITLLGREQFVTVASKHKEKTNEAPSIITVITAEEIENMGAMVLTDILRTVPGFDIIKDGAFGRTDYVARGIRNILTSDNKIKTLIDGHSLNMPYNGASAYFFDDLPLKNVKKIEIIRGPGSSLYGANAFLAVINIITKEADDIDGVEITSGFGSFDTQKYNIMYGKNISDIDITGFVDFYNTNGLSDTIKEDPMSGQPFSVTPGDTDDGRKRLDTHVKLAYKDLQFIAKYLNKNTESFVGSNFVLTNESENKFNYVMGELNYKISIGEKLTLKPRTYYDQYDIEFGAEPFPDGFVIPADVDGDGDIEEFPDGLKGRGIATNRRLGGEIQMDYAFSEHNTFTLGVDYKWERQDNVQFYANFDPLNSASLGSLQNVSDTGNWIRRVYRQVWAVYMQEKWNITDDMGLTIGIRHDHYSDFEGTTNPRIGFVWDFVDNATLKLLYGQAFRAPAFNELYTTNNPVSLGNPDLKPETIRTYEVGLGYKFTNRYSTNVNYFFNVIRDEIFLVPQSDPNAVDVYMNRGGANVQGIEFEIKADLDNIWKGAYAFANYSYLDAEAKGDPLPDVPKHKGNVGINAGITKYLNANLHAFISGKRIRAEQDARDDSPGYGIVNLTLTAKEFFKEMKVKASIFNLLDKDYNDPAPINTIPTDLPRPGRTFFIELGYQF